MKILKNKQFLSFLLPTILFLITYYLIGFKYCTDDDGSIARIVANGYINPFSLIWTSHFSCFLHNTISFISGWGLFTLGSTYFAICKFTNLILNFKNKQIRTIGLISLIIITIDVLIQCNFTKTAFILVCIGIIYIQEYFNKKKKSNVILGIVMLFVGFSIRPDTIYIIFPFIGAYVLIKFIQNKNKKEFFLQSTTYILIFVSLLSILTINDKLLEKDLSEYLRYNYTRSEYLDYNREKIKTDKSVDVNKITTISKNDLDALNNYFYGDTEIFTTEKFEALDEEITKIDNSKKLFGQKLIINIKKVTYHPLWIILLFLLLINFKRKENLIYLLGVILFTCAFTYIARFPDRIMFCILTGACLILLYQLKDTENLLNKKVIKIIFTISIIISTFIKFLIPIFIILNTNTMPINNYIKENSQNDYLIGYSMTIERQYETNVLSRETDDPKKNFIVTSWFIKHPFYENILKERNIKNINTDLVEKDNYYMVSYKDDKDCIIMEKYLEEHYYKNVEYELIDEINEYKIWKFKKEGVKK